MIGSAACDLVNTEIDLCILSFAENLHLTPVSIFVCLYFFRPRFQYCWGRGSTVCGE